MVKDYIFREKIILFFKKILILKILQNRARFYLTAYLFVDTIVTINSLCKG